MVVIARALVREVLANATRGQEGALVGLGATTEVRGLVATSSPGVFRSGGMSDEVLGEMGGRLGMKGLAQLGYWRPAAGGPAKPEAGEFPAGKPDFLVLVVAVRDGTSAEWAFWRLDPGTRLPVPEPVHIIP